MDGNIFLAHSSKLASTRQVKSTKGLEALRMVMDSTSAMATFFTTNLHS